MPRILIARPDAAQLLSISLRKLDQLIRNHAIKIVKIGKRTLIPQAELENFADENTNPKPSQTGGRHAQ
jgi:excisionase family DNA binding protein